MLDAFYNPTRTTIHIHLPWDVLEVLWRGGDTFGKSIFNDQHPNTQHVRCTQYWEALENSSQEHHVDNGETFRILDPHPMCATHPHIKVVCLCVGKLVHADIHIYIYREREREGHIYIYMHIYIYFDKAS